MTGFRMTSALAAALLTLAAGPAPAQDNAPTAEGAGLETVILAGGCFWCVEADFDKLPGVVDTVSGYTGGQTEAPTYKQVTYGDTGHYEAVKITYDPDAVSLETLFRAFFRSVDPLDAGGQFCDRGPSYRTAVFVEGAGERATAEAAKAEAAETLGAEVVTPVLDEAPFWRAEAYHQDYYDKNPYQYRYYRWSCGRDARVEELWGAPAGESFTEIGAGS